MLSSLLIICSFFFVVDGILEEFIVRGPDVLQERALNELFAQRKASNNEETIEYLVSDESPMMKRAKDYAVSRGDTRSEESLRIQV